jgi:hypothetical protein
MFAAMKRVLLAAMCGVALGAQDSIGARAQAATARVDPALLRRTVHDLVAFHSRHVRSATDDPARGTGAARTYLEQRLREAGAAAGDRLQVERKAYQVTSTRLRAGVEVVNLVATLRGTTDPDRVYVIGGHYDSINADSSNAQGQAPGANDDASGTAVVIEALRALADQPLAATVLFACYDGEEMGLLGSTEHAKELKANNVQVDGMLTNDIVGNTLGMDGVKQDGYLRCFSYAERGNDSLGRSLARAVTYAARTHVPDLAVHMVLRGDRYGRGGDHRPFFSAGYPAARLTEAREDFSRQHADVVTRDGKPYGDLPEFVDFDYLARVCRVNVATLCELASAPPAPATVRARGARRAYDTSVSWRPVAGDVRYELVWRATTSADWEGAALVPAADLAQERGMRSTTLRGQCLDDIVVGVRSVSALGARSRVTTPPEPDAFEARR